MRFIGLKPKKIVRSMHVNMIEHVIENIVYVQYLKI